MTSEGIICVLQWNGDWEENINRDLYNRSGVRVADIDVVRAGVDAKWINKATMLRLSPRVVAQFTSKTLKSTAMGFFAKRKYH